LRHVHPVQEATVVHRGCLQVLGPHRIPSTTSPTTMDEVMKLLPTLMTPANMAEARAEVMRSFEHDQAIQCRNLRPLSPPPPGPATETETSTFLKDIDSEPVQLHSALRRMMEESLHPRYPPPTALPCANVQAEKYAVCKNPGKMACSACKLVSYCSKVRNK